MRIGRYVIRGLLGRGGMGKVFKVELPPVAKIAALKLFAPDALLVGIMGRSRLLDLFMHEAATIASLRHPNVVAIHDFDQQDGAPFFVMDYFADSLGSMLGEPYEVERETRRLSIDRALDYTRQILQGLACLHDAGIVHRDIKPFNLLVTPWDSIQICDFGLSKLRGEAFGAPPNLNVGSPYYAAPEQEADPDKAEATADLYPVGVILYRMLTGRLPVISPLGITICPPSRLNLDLDAAWDVWMTRALAPRPEERFPSAVAMMRELELLTAHWADQKAGVCERPQDDRTRADPVRSPASLRAIPLQIRPRRAADLFKVDSLWRPRFYFANDFVPGPEGTVVDRAAGLIWEQSGSPFPRTWYKAQAYIQRLNLRRHAEITHWRLPTMEELLSLVRPPPKTKDLCVAPLFDATQRKLWSADRRSPIAAYYLDSELGFVGWQDFSALYYARGVGSITAIRKV